jgi:APA family basic amino acid/polyamine antiporter
MSQKKQLSFLDVFCLASGAMISSGIFILPGLAFANAGPGVIISYFLAGLLAISGALSAIELTTAMPKTGGDYYVISSTFGPLVGTISGLFSWLAISLKTAFAIFGIAEIIYLFSGTPIILSATLLCILFTCLNIRGTKEVTFLEVLLVVFLFALLAAFIGFGFPSIRSQRFFPLDPYGWNAILSTAGLIFVSFGGLLNIASIAEEIKTPKKTIPQAMLAAVICITLLYTLILIITVGVLPPDTLASSLTPIADCAKQTMGSIGFYIISIASLLAFVTTAIAGLMSASRYIVGLAKDKMVPAVGSNHHNLYATPHIALLITGTLIFLALLLDVKQLATIASTVVLLSFILSNVSLIVFRESKIRNYRPSFRVPLYPVLPILNIVLFTFLIIDMGIEAAEIGIGFVVMGILCYVFYGRHNSSREFALVHLIERVVDKKISGHSLETELREIVHERDDVTHDRFDELIKEAMIIDLDSVTTKDDLFHVLATHAASIVQTDATKLESLLQEREAESSTAISPVVAIPHIILDGEGVFKLVVARSKDGVRFNDKYTAVQAVFLLMGTKDERNFHLQALAAIAQIVHNEQFKEQWMSADTTEHLKDTLLLSRRQRE